MDQVMGKSEKEDVDEMKIAQVEMENDELATKVDPHGVQGWMRQFFWRRFTQIRHVLASTFEHFDWLNIFGYQKCFMVTPGIKLGSAAWQARGLTTTLSQLDLIKRYNLMTIKLRQNVHYFILDIGWSFVMKYKLVIFD